MNINEATPLQQKEDEKHGNDYTVDRCDYFINFFNDLCNALNKCCLCCSFLGNC
jgi:hypothetical protein